MPGCRWRLSFFFKDPAPPEIYTLSLHDALPISEPAKQLRLIRSCRGIAGAARRDCYAWLGRTLAVVTNGAFRERGCARLGANARRACSSGAARMGAALVTFS